MSWLRLPAPSIRVRLTAWYALLLAVLLLVLGIFVFRLVEERLYADTATRLTQTAGDVRRGIGQRRVALSWDETGAPTIAGISQDLKQFGDYGQQFVQVVNAQNKVVKASPYSPADVSMVADWDIQAYDQAVFWTTSVNGVETRVICDPLIATGQSGRDYTIGAVVVGEPLKGLKSTLGALRQTLVITSGAGLLLAIVGGWVLADRALRPVDRVTAAAAKIASGDGTAASLSTRLAVPATGDELTRLSATFNEMLDRLEASFHTQQRFVADASHELRTPLTAVRGNVEVLARQLAAQGEGAGNGDVAAALEDVQRESARMGRLIDDLLLLARSDGIETKGNGGQAALDRTPVDLALVASDAVRIAAGLAHGQELAVVAPEPVIIAGDRDRLQQLLMILLDNAVRHTPAGKRITVEVVPPVVGMATLVVRDEGEGIAPEHLAHVFDRFYRADGARGRATGGTGLGLAIARVIARGHDGEITVSSEPGRGSEFRVTLPVTAPPPDAARAG